MPTRYDNIRTVINDNQQYSNLFEEKGRKFIEQDESAVIKEVTQEMRLRLTKVPHVWSSGDKYHVLSAKYYDNSRYWWLIAWFNQKPTEQHVSIGDVIEIPVPLNQALTFYYGG